MTRLILTILWPSFLVAIAAEGFFFSLFDPQELAIAGNVVDVSSKAVYTIGFFCFWSFCALASMLTYYLTHVPRDRPPHF